MARVYISTVVNARNDRVWARVRDFNGLPNWHPAIAESRIEGGEPADKIGCVRDFRLRNGDRIREKLLGLSDYDMFCTYSIRIRLLTRTGSRTRRQYRWRRVPGRF
jgi:hypothetical protein